MAICGVARVSAGASAWRMRGGDRPEWIWEDDRRARDCGAARAVAERPDRARGASAAEARPRTVAGRRHRRDRRRLGAVAPGRRACRRRGPAVAGNDRGGRRLRRVRDIRELARRVVAKSLRARAPREPSGRGAWRWPAGRRGRRIACSSGRDLVGSVGLAAGAVGGHAGLAAGDRAASRERRGLCDARP
jgi:hypothetical protein